MQTQTQAHTCTETLTHICIDEHIYAENNAHATACMQTHTHTHSHNTTHTTHTHHTHGQTHTHTEQHHKSDRNECVIERMRNNCFSIFVLTASCEGAGQYENQETH